ncbi:hypothetical protein ACFQ12_13185 [Methylobacterium trifolii]
MNAALLALPILALATATGLAAGPGERAEGSYERAGAYSQSAKVIVMDAPDDFAASFQTSTAGCVGSVGALGKATGPREIVFTKRDETGGLCRLTMRFTPDFRSAEISEDKCLYWHGAACDFSGRLKRVGR